MILKDVLPLGGITYNDKDNTLTTTGNSHLTPQKRYYICVCVWKVHQMLNEARTYPSVEGRHVKMSAGCKHREQRDRELLAGIVDIYGFSSWQPHRPTKKTDLKLKMNNNSAFDVKITLVWKFLLKHVTMNSITQCVKGETCSKWPVSCTMLCLYSMNISALKYKHVQNETIYVRLLTQTANNKRLCIYQSAHFSGTHARNCTTCAKMKVNVIQSHTGLQHIRLLKDFSWPFKADSNRRKLSSSALYITMFLWPARKDMCEFYHGGQWKQLKIRYWFRLTTSECGHRWWCQKTTA